MLTLNDQSGDFMNKEWLTKWLQRENKNIIFAKEGLEFELKNYEQGIKRARKKLNRLIRIEKKIQTALNTFDEELLYEGSKELDEWLHKNHYK